MINKGGVSQINCQTSGNYGSFTVTASIIIDCGTGAIGNITVGSTVNAITINTASAATIILRHLSLTSVDPTSHFYGIGTTLFSSGTLIVEDCNIQGFGNGSGIYFAPSAGRGLLQVSNTQSFGNGNGIFVGPSNGQIASVTLNRVELLTNFGSGLRLGIVSNAAVIAGTMRDSVAGANGQTGVYADAGQVYFTVERSSIVANLVNGIQANSASTVLNVGETTIGGNGTGVKATAGQIISFGNNQMSANGTNGNFTSTTTLR